MGDYSRDSFRVTQNSLIDVRGLLAVPQTNPKHYVSIRLQQGVPMLDADWNEQEDIRRIELETVLAQAIGSGVPAGSDGFRIFQTSIDNNFMISSGIMFLDGLIVINHQEIDYNNQPHRNTSGVSPEILPIENAAVAQRELVYLDTWDREADAQEDSHLVDQNIGIETCSRLERAWVIRIATITSTADPFDPATIPTIVSDHRYYALAIINRQPGGVITDGMISDLRRTHLTLEALTHAPLLIDDPVRGQRLNSERLADMFHNTLDVLWDRLSRTPDTFIVFIGVFGREPESGIAMTALQDIRARAIAFEEQARRDILHKTAALESMNGFYDVQVVLLDLLRQFIDNGMNTTSRAEFVEICRRHLQGSGPGDNQSLNFALTEEDLLGAVMAQERFIIEMGAVNDLFPEGTVSASLISITPLGPVQDNTIQPQYHLTIRVDSNLQSEQGFEPMRAIASAGSGWNLSFQDTAETDVREIVVTVDNMTTQDIVLIISATPGAADSALELSVRPERRQSLAFHHTPINLALGQEILPGGPVLATMTYEGPALPPDNTAQVARNVMSGGVQIPFEATNLSSSAEQYQVTVTAMGDDTGWNAPNQPVLPEMAPGEVRLVDIDFSTSDELGAMSPLTYRVQLVRVTGGANEPLANTIFDLTFDLQP